VRYLLGLIVGLVALWLLLSGHYTPMILGFGAGSCVFTIWICRRLDIVNGEGVPVELLPRLPGYLLWLFIQILRSSLEVALLILRPKSAISPTMVQLPAHQQTAMGQAIFANSVTLTPGTITVGLRRGTAEVHALCRTSTQDLEGGHIDQRVRRLERGLHDQSPVGR